MPRRSPLVVVMLIALVCSTGRAASPRGADAPGWLLDPGFCPEEGAAHREAYAPRAGDLVFFSHHSLRSAFLFGLAHTGQPYHVGIVVDLPDGRPAVLEAGPYDYVHVYLMDLLPRMRTHEGPIWVRRLRTPLSPEQSARLTSYALAQTGKRFAFVRVILEATPLHAHGSLHSRLFGSARTERHSWFCSELVVAAMAVAGLTDPHTMKPNTLFPRDLFYDRPFDLKPCWEEPRRWTCDP